MDVILKGVSSEKLCVLKSYVGDSIIELRDEIRVLKDKCDVLEKHGVSCQHYLKTLEVKHNDLSYLEYIFHLL